MSELVYRGGRTSTYASSIAATWVWTPAIFVSSSIAYLNGLYGLGWFLIPNVLTLILFGFLVQRFLNQKETEEFTGIGNIFGENRKQRMLHSLISLVILICSTCVQFVGLFLLLQVYFPNIDLMTSCLCVSLFCYLYSKLGGIKTCIITDKMKYFTILVIGIILGYIAIDMNMSSIGNIKLLGINSPSFIDISMSFGIITAVGLFASPYIDNTFWQRVFSIRKDKIFETFFLGAIFFFFIPFIFGMIGLLFTCSMNDVGWAITKTFGDNPVIRMMLFIAIFMALISTIDSNLCAVEELTFSLCPKVKKISMELLLIVACLVTIVFEPSIIGLFLVYGTIRTSMCLPTVLLMSKKYYSENRLFVFSVLSVLVGSIGYASMFFLGLPYGFVFTLLALLIPILAIKI